MREINATHDPARRSWIASANAPGTDFPIQNLPFGVFRHDGRTRGGVAIGNYIFDLEAGIRADLFSGATLVAAHEATKPQLNSLMAMGPDAAGALRAALSDILSDQGANSNSIRAREQLLLMPQDEAEMQLPCEVRNYTDFLTSAHHTERHGRLKGLAVPLPPAFKSLPIAYHGRSSSIRPSGWIVRRPNGQWKGSGGSEFGPVVSMDFELELGAFVGRGNKLGEPIPIQDASRHIFGYCLLNDWSAKGVQWWEQVLGPFLGKNFATTVSPWIVTEEALAPFRSRAHPRDPGDPQVLPYLKSEEEEARGGLELKLSASLQSNLMRDRGLAAKVITRTSSRHMYWSFGQMLAHHASNGCNLQSGDLLGSGTISGPAREEMACMTEMTEAGAKPLALGNGEVRAWLEDGDEIILQARAEREGFVGIGFGQCKGRIASSVAWPEPKAELERAS